MEDEEGIAVQGTTLTLELDGGMLIVRDNIDSPSDRIMVVLGGSEGNDELGPFIMALIKIANQRGIKYGATE